MIITAEQLRSVMRFSTGRIPTFIVPLAAAMEEFAITTAHRQAAFLAQIAHESGELRFVLELARGDAYEGRVDLGNTMPGDGMRYKGRGLIQITGRANYEACGKALSMDLISSPSLLETPIAACRSAGWFWQTRGLNELADLDKFGAITRKINGGYNGMDDRLGYWLRARHAFGL